MELFVKLQSFYLLVARLGLLVGSYLSSYTILGQPAGPATPGLTFFSSALCRSGHHKPSALSASCGPPRRTRASRRPYAVQWRDLPLQLLEILSWSVLPQLGNQKSNKRLQRIKLNFYRKRQTDLTHHIAALMRPQCSDCDVATNTVPPTVIII